VSGTTTNSWRKRIKRYKDQFGQNVHDQDPNQMFMNLFNYVLDNKNTDKSATKRNIIDNFYAIISVIGKASKISEYVQGKRREIHKILGKQEVKHRAKGISKGWIAFSDFDFHHMFNHIEKQFGDLPLNKLQLLLLLILGKVTGRRSGELTWIAASSWIKLKKKLYLS
jgi:hypothetical protein